MFDYDFLQHYWWFIISLLGGLLVFLLFVQGGQSLLFSLPKTDAERKLMVNAMGRKWEYTFTTLVTFGGAFFASFPLFYSTSFGGAYWVWMAILFCFVLQAVSYEFMHKPNNVFGPKTFRVFLFINGVFGTFLLGAAVATFFTGSEFTVNKANFVNIITDGNSGGLVISAWASAWHGLEALGNFRNWLLGFAVLFLARTLACLFLINRLADEELIKKAQKALIINAICFLVPFLGFLIWTLLAEGFAVTDAGNVVLMKYKYFFNLIQMPIVGICFLIGVVLVLFGIGRSVFDKKYRCGIWFAGIGTVVTVTCLFLIAGWNGTSFYPSTIETASGVYNNSLTIQNASSSPFTLRVMSFVSLLVPFVLAYIFYAWNSLEKKKFDIKDLKDDGHVY